MATIEIKVPDIGDFAEVTVIELLVKPGDTIKPEQSLITVESDKASMEIPSSQGGVVKELKIKLGDKVKEGTVLLLLEAAGAQASSAPAPAASPATAPAAPCCGCGRCSPGTCCLIIRWQRRHRLRPARFGRRPRRLFGRVPGCRFGPEGGDH